MSEQSPRIMVPDFCPPEPKMLGKPCKFCPSAHYDPDPEALDILRAPHPVRVENVFTCGWNVSRYCRGYCDRSGVSAEDVKREHKRRYGDEV